MAVTTDTGRLVHPAAHKTPQILLTGAAIEGISGLAGIVLAILGLTNIMPAYMVAIAAIAIGAGFMLEGAAIASRYSRLLAAAGGERSEQAEIGGGATAEFIGGAAGIVLGILALLNIAPVATTASAAIVFGAAMVLGSGTVAKLNAFHVWGTEHSRMQQIADESVKAASGAQALAGLASAVLGILAIVGIQPMTLTLVAFLVAGASQLLSGSAEAGKMATVETAS